MSPTAPPIEGPVMTSSVLARAARACASPAVGRALLRAAFVATAVWLWLELTPVAGDTMAALLHRPGGTRVLWLMLGGVVLARWLAPRWHRWMGGDVQTTRLAPLGVARFGHGHGRERDARHEACHAVVALALDGVVHRLELHTEGGQCDNAQPQQDRLVDMLWDELAVGLAGYGDDLARQVYDAGARHDIALVLQRAAAIIACGQHPHGYEGPLTTDALITSATARARDLLAAREDEVQVVTARLLDAPAQRLVGLTTRDLRTVQTVTA